MARDGAMPPPMSDLAAEILEHAPCGIAVCDVDGTLRLANRTLRFWIGDDGVVEEGRRLQELLTAPGRIYYETHIAPMLRLQGFVREIACQLAQREGGARNVLLNAVLRKAEGNGSDRLDVTIFDATERSEYERTLRQARYEAEQLASVVRSSPNAILRISENGDVITWNAAAERLFDVTAAAAEGRSIRDLIRLQDDPRWFDRTAKLADSKGEQHFQAAHETGRDLEITICPIGEPEVATGRRDYSVILRDVSDRVRAERHLKLVVAELKHRVKNTISVVSGIARQTFRPAVSAEQFDIFADRLAALSRAHDLLTEEHWESVGLSDLIEIVATEAGGPARFRAEGPDIRLPAQVATGLSMVLHELTTNALKYGALSAAEGVVSVVWTVCPESRALELSWEERGGPPVAEPERRGFGTKLIELMIAEKPGSEATIDYAREGLRCRLNLQYGASGEGEVRSAAP